MITINTGFFDPQNQKTISYIINDGQTIEDPIFNENIMSNAVLRQNMKKRRKNYEQETFTYNRCGQVYFF